MNRINFDNTGGFPLGTYTLDFMQKSYQLLNALGNIAGNLSILSGCEEVGRSITDGVVYIDGEVLPFKGAPISEKVIIVETSQKRIFKDGVEKAVEYTRYATFGNSINGHLWADFKRPLNNQQIEAQSFTEENSLLRRLEKLEERVRKTVPIGLVAIWDRPASEIPEGWEEHTEMQGVVPVGYKSDDSDFGAIGTKVGSKTVSIEKNNLPDIEIDLKNKNGSGFEVIGFNLENYSGQNEGGWSNSGSLPYWGKESGNNIKAHLNGKEQPINNIQPSRIVKFIRFVGF
jgi:hypothetical protein|nr:MAG TPA: hypothetical protein [Caudoviricetes sp.]